jgi:hypothetical protein
MARDKINSVRIKPTIAMLIQRYNTVIVGSCTIIRLSCKQLEPYMTVFTFHSYIYRKKKKNIRCVGSKNSSREHNI